MRYTVTLAWRNATGIATARARRPKVEKFCALHKNLLDRRSRGFYITVVLQCSESKRQHGCKSSLAGRSPGFQRFRRCHA
jgi:hypothetical protein